MRKPAVAMALSLSHETHRDTHLSNEPMLLCRPHTAGKPVIYSSAAIPPNSNIIIIIIVSPSKWVSIIIVCICCAALALAIFVELGENFFELYVESLSHILVVQLWIAEISAPRNRYWNSWCVMHLSRAICYIHLIEGINRSKLKLIINEHLGPLIILIIFSPLWVRYIILNWIEWKL